MLGVIIGTGAVIGVGSIIAGLDGAITGLMRSFGPNTVIVTKTAAMGNATREERRRKPLTLENARAIAERCPSVEHVSPYLFPPQGLHNARYKGNDLYGMQLGGTEEGYAAGGTTMKCGRFFTDEESRHHMPVVVIGEDVQKQLLPNEDPIDKWIEVDGHAAAGGRRDGPAGRIAARSGRHARPAAVLHDAQDVPQRAGAHAGRDRLSRHGDAGAGRSPRGAADRRAACRSTRRTRSRSRQPSR